MNHEVGDLVWDEHDAEIGVIVKIWTKEEIHEQGLEYDEYLYQVYFPTSGFDRFRDESIADMKGDLEIQRLKSK